MKIISFVHEGLGNSSYVVGLDGGFAVAVDPDRSVARYLRAAEAHGWTIGAVLETHLHADFVSGAHELYAATGARLFIPAGAASRLPHDGLQPGEQITMHGIGVEAIASPGHTPEHMSYVVRSGSAPDVLFSGGSLIVGGAARTDLIAPEQTEELTCAQYRTLHDAFSTLPDSTMLYPTHGGGSFCSTGSGSERVSTLGAERASNPALHIESEEEFARWFPTTFPAAPLYYFRMRAFNQSGPRLKNTIALPRVVGAGEFDRVAQNALIVDVRDVESYSRAHIEGSLHIEFRDSFAVWLGWLVPADTPLLFVGDASMLSDTVDQALLVGYERFAGWLEGDIKTLRASGRPLRTIDYIDGARARALIDEGARAIDVRERSEWESGHATGSVHAPLGTLERDGMSIPHDTPVVVYCGHGERASTGASILERAGYREIANVRGGLSALLVN
jgi:glyoxylase-like metal-dependent hydrolase (beta-lactamase superfamily II)/rhodanese-related sulfurtransferase